MGALRIGANFFQFSERPPLIEMFEYSFYSMTVSTLS